MNSHKERQLNNNKVKQIPLNTTLGQTCILYLHNDTYPSTFINYYIITFN